MWSIVGTCEPVEVKLNPCLDVYRSALKSGGSPLVSHYDPPDMAVDKASPSSSSSSSKLQKGLLEGVRRVLKSNLLIWSHLLDHACYQVVDLSSVIQFVCWAVCCACWSSLGLGVCD